MAPYRSEAQRRKLHELVKQGKLSQAVVDEFDHASKGLRLPERVKSKESKPKKTKLGKVKVI